MVCVQCGAENPESAKYCTSCNALLFQVAPTGLPETSTIDLDADIDYPFPTYHYQSPILEQLAWAVHEFMEEDGELEPVIETYDAFREIYAGFQVEIPGIEELFYTSEGTIEDDLTPKYVRYLLGNAKRGYQVGETSFEQYFDLVDNLAEDAEFPEPKLLVEGVKSWLSCNDNICMTFELLTGQNQAITGILDDLAARQAAGEDIFAVANENEAADESAVAQSSETN